MEFGDDYVNKEKIQRYSPNTNMRLVLEPATPRRIIYPHFCMEQYKMQSTKFCNFVYINLCLKETG